ncbi:MAG: histidine kinase dimerization/phospho-acceptor domain-containing protein, partial [Limisphaerales bacterium]
MAALREQALRLEADDAKAKQAAGESQQELNVVRAELDMLMRQLATRTEELSATEAKLKAESDQREHVEAALVRASSESDAQVAERLAVFDAAKQSWQQDTARLHESQEELRKTNEELSVRLAQLTGDVEAARQEAEKETSQRRALEESIQVHQGELELRISERTANLNALVQRLEAELSESQRAEEQLRHRRIEAVSTLAGGMAHELNNVLAPVLMASQLLRKQVSGKSKTLVESVEASAQRGADIVKQVLTFARGFHGERAPVSPEMLVREVVQAVQDTFPRNVRVSSEVAEELP